MAKENKLSSNSSVKIAFVHSCWHENIVEAGRKGFLEHAEALGLSESQIDFYKVPGAFELPLKCKQLSTTRKYALIIAAGLIVDGGIYRHEFVAQSVISGLMQVQLATGIPVLSMVLTPQEFDESQGRIEFFLDHLKLKGREISEAAHAILKTNTTALLPGSDTGIS